MQSLKLYGSLQTGKGKLNLPQICRFYTDEKAPGIPVNIRDQFNRSQHQPCGPMVDKKPFKMTLQANKSYSWCLCGKSKSQPICDGTHKNVFLKIKERPIKFAVEKTGDYWLCMCKQTKHRPFCDGTHKEEFVQEKFKKY